MNTENQIPRVSISWLLLSQIAVIVPHLTRMPWWIFVIWLLCALWRLAMFRGRASYPNVLLRSMLVALGTIGVVISYGGLHGLDIAVALLLLSFSLKVLEVKQRRDLNLLFYLAFVVIATAFLFSQSIYLAAYQILCILLVLTAMVATQRSNRNRSPFQALRVTSYLLLQATPIMLVFFLVFPRLEPFWRVPDRTKQATTGMSEFMAPGDIAKLNRSGKLVFRVYFEKEIPEPSQLYWRGFTLMNFDGRTWSRDKSTGEPDYATSRQYLPEYLPGEPITYNVIMEPTQQNWLYPLPQMISVDLGQSNSQTSTLADLGVYAEKPFQKRSSLRYQSLLQVKKGLTEAGSTLQNATALPQGYNPKTLSLAKELFSGSSSIDGYIDQIKNLISEGDYYYTLEPPALGYHGIDEFLFDTRKGFCEHYSAAAVVLLRAAGIPARVVVGYQGGELNPFSEALIVRQYDAHAWVEYWQAGSGWIRFDPTASVAPDRILMGMQGALQTDPNIEGSIFSPLYFRNLPLIRDLRVRLEALNIGWQTWVVNFSSAKQTHLLEKLLGNATPLRTGMLVLGTMFGMFMITAMMVAWRRSRKNLSIEQRYYQLFQQKLARLGIQRNLSEAPGSFGRRVAREYPHLRNDVLSINAQYEAICYGGKDSLSDISRLKRLVYAFSPAKNTPTA